MAATNAPYSMMVHAPDKGNVPGVDQRVPAPFDIDVISDLGRVTVAVQVQDQCRLSLRQALDHTEAG